MNKTYIRTMDEGYYVDADESGGVTALMVNPAASKELLIEAAMVRVTRIANLAKPFLEAERIDLSMDQEDFVRVLNSLGFIAHEARQMLLAALGGPISDDVGGLRGDH